MSPENVKSMRQSLGAFNRRDKTARLDEPSVVECSHVVVS
jgi:hypothetical protein